MAMLTNTDVRAYARAFLVVARAWLARRREPRCCGNCRFYSPPPPEAVEKGAKAGDCRRVHPIVLMIPRQVSRLSAGPGQTMIVPCGYFPEVLPTIWCGEHRR